MNNQGQPTYRVPAIGLCICLLMTVALFSFDIYYPSLPDIATGFGVSASHIQLSVSLYFLPLAFSQLIFGPLSNSYGRRLMLLTGTVVSLTGSIVCSLSPIVGVFIAGRFLQGIGVGAYYTLTRAVMRDIFEGAKLARFNSLISAVLSLSPCLAPILGSYCHTYFGWRSNFFLLSFLFGLCFTIIYFFLPETRKATTKAKFLFSDYVAFLKNRTFIYYMICSALAYSGLVSFLTMAPFIFECELALTPIEFSFISLWVMLGLTLGALLNSHLVMKCSLHKLIAVSGILIILSGASLTLLTTFYMRNVLTIAIPSVLFSIACNIIFANASAGALTPIDIHSIGTGSALFGCIQIVGPALASTLIMALPFEYIHMLESSYLLIGAAILWLLRKILQSADTTEKKVQKECIERLM